jgi:ankyrin repeat protein
MSLLNFCKNKDSVRAMAMLKNPEMCKMDEVYRYGRCTALMFACKNKMEKVALEILKYPEICKMNCRNRDGDTALILACRNKMVKVALELLKYPDMCDINRVNEQKETALICAFKNNTYDIAIEILKHRDTNISDVPSKFVGYMSDMMHQDRETLNKLTEENNDLKNTLVVKKKNEFGFLTTYY